MDTERERHWILFQVQRITTISFKQGNGLICFKITLERKKSPWLKYRGSIVAGGEATSKRVLNC